MSDEPALDTPEQIARFLAVLGCVKNAKLHSRPLHELLHTLFKPSVHTNTVLTQFTLATIGYILLGISRAHFAECEELHGAIYEQRPPFDVETPDSCFALPECLVEDDIAFLASDPYLALVRRTHSTGGHGSAEAFISLHKIDAALEACNYKPLRRIQMPHNSSGSELQSPGSNRSRHSADNPNDTNDHGDTTRVASPNGSQASFAVGSPHASRHQRHRTACRAEPSFHLADPVLLSRTNAAAAAPQGSPTPSELAELEANSMQIILDPTLFPNGAPALDRAPGADDTDAFQMMQRRPATYREAVDPHARNFDESGANYDFSLENKAFLGLDAALPRRQQIAGPELEFSAGSLAVDFSSESSLPQNSLGPDDAQILLDSSPPSRVLSDSSSPGARPEADIHEDSYSYDLNPLWPENSDPVLPEAEAEAEAEAEHVSLDADHRSSSQAPAQHSTPVPEQGNRTPPNGVTGQDLIVWDPRQSAHLLPITPCPPSRSFFSTATPPQSPPSSRGLASLSYSARRLPALVLGIDYDIPPPPTFVNADDVATSNSSRSLDNDNAVVNSDDQHDDDVRPRRPTRPTRPREALHKSTGAIDENINGAVVADEDVLSQLERVLKWDRLLHPPQPAEALRPDSPVPTEEELPGIELQLLRNLMAMENRSPGPRRRLREPQGIADVALQYEPAATNTTLNRSSPGIQRRLIEGSAHPRSPQDAIDGVESGGFEMGGFDNETIDRGMSPADAPSPHASVHTVATATASATASASASASARSPEESFEMIDVSELRGMPYPSSISLDNSGLVQEAEPRHLQPVQAMDHIHGSSSNSSPRLEDGMSSGNRETPQPPSGSDEPMLNSSPPSLPSLALSMNDMPSPPLFVDDMPSSDPHEENDEGYAAGANQEPVIQDESEPANDEGPRPQRSAENDVEQEESRQRLAWQQPPARPALERYILFTPIEEQLRLSIGPSPFWRVSEGEMTSYVQTKLAAAKSNGKVTFPDLCDEAPWQTNSIEDFNLDSDLFHALLSAATRKLVVLEQDTSQVGGELFVVDANE